LRTLSGCKGEQFYKKHGWTHFGEKNAEIGGKTYTEIWFIFAAL
jgi:hypothetical protein